MKTTTEEVAASWLNGNRTSAVEEWVKMDREDRREVVEKLLFESLKGDTETMASFAYLAFVAGTEERS